MKNITQISIHKRPLLRRLVTTQICLYGLLFASLCLTKSAFAEDIPIVFNNIEELQAYDPSTFPKTNVTWVAALVLGYYTPGDRGGGTFQWQPDATFTADGGRYLTSLNPNSPPGRWVRILNGEVANVRMWGAKGGAENGMQSAPDDTVAIQNAVSACVMPWTQELLFPSGFYKVTDTIVFFHWIHIRGENPWISKVIMQEGINKDIFCSDNAYYAVNGGGRVDCDHGLIFENLGVQFEVNRAIQDENRNVSNACIAIANPGEAMEMRNLCLWYGGYGIRCYGGGAPGLKARNVNVGFNAIAGISQEPLPGHDSDDGANMTLIGISGDYVWTSHADTAALIRFSHCKPTVTIQDFKAEGSWGGGVVQFDSCGPLASARIEGGSYNTGLYPNLTNVPADLVVIKGDAPFLSIHSPKLYGVRYLIRDEATGRNVETDCNISGNYQMATPLPIHYYSATGGGIAPSISRLVVGQTALSYLYATNVGWYRVMHNKGRNLSARLSISNIKDTSYEMQIDASRYIVPPYGTWINVTRAPHISAGPAVITKARVYAYWDNNDTVQNVDVYVENPIPLAGLFPHEQRIAFAVDINGAERSDSHDVNLMGQILPVPAELPAGAENYQMTVSTYRTDDSSSGGSGGAVNLATATGNLPVANLNGGTGASSATYWRGDGVWSQVNLQSGVTGILPLANLGVIDPAHGGLGLNASAWTAGLVPYTTATGTFGSAPISSFVTNNATGVTLTGTFNGNGSGLTNLAVPNYKTNCLTSITLENMKSAWSGGAANELTFSRTPNIDFYAYQYPTGAYSVVYFHLNPEQIGNWTNIAVTATVLTTNGFAAGNFWIQHNSMLNDGTRFSPPNPRIWPVFPAGTNVTQIAMRYSISPLATNAPVNMTWGTESQPLGGNMWLLGIKVEAY